MKISLKMKLMGSFFIVALITGTVGTMGALNVRKSVEDTKMLGYVALPSVTQLEVMKEKFMEIKSAIRTLASPFLSEADIKLQFEVIEKARAEYKEAAMSYEKVQTTPEQKALYDKMLEKVAVSSKLNNELIEMSKDFLDKDVDKMALAAHLSKEAMSGEVKVAFDELVVAIDAVINYANKYYGVDMVEKANRDGTFNRIAMVSTSFTGSFFALLIGFIISMSITKPVNKISAELFASAGNLESAAGQVSSSSQELSSGASELASSVEEMTSSLEELQSIIESNSKNINESEVIMRETMTGSKLAVEQMAELNRSHGEIRDNSKRIGKIIKVIDDIAFQTNILALNAAVEAARAGDAGKGFAVVADQVKSLAQKSADAAKETSDLIETSINSVNHGYSLGENVSESLNKAFDLSAKVEALLEEVNKASREQLKGAYQVTKAISQINTVVQQTASSSEETAAAGEELLGQAEVTKGIVARLNVLIKGENDRSLYTMPDTNVTRVNEQHADTKSNSPKLSTSDDGRSERSSEKQIPFDEF